MSFEGFVAGRYLRPGRLSFISLITVLSVSGVAVGVMALIIVIGVMAGFEADLKARILSVQSHVVVERRDGGFEEHRQAADYLKTLEGVALASPFVSSPGLVRSLSGAISGAVVKGIVPESAGRIARYFDPGGLEGLRLMKAGPGEDDLPGIVLGRELAQGLGIFKGDAAYIISPRGMISPAGHLPSMRRFRVVGLFESGMYEYDGSFAYIHLHEAQKILRMGHAVSGIEMELTDIYKALKIADQAAQGLGPSYITKHWMEMNRNFFFALKLEKTMMFIILTLIVLVAAFNIASSLIMMVMEKRRDIAILKAMGAQDHRIRQIFILKGLAIGGIGTGLGTSVGVLLCILLERYEFVKLPPAIYYVTKLPVHLELGDILMISLASLAICALATVYPANQAASLNPVEALRYG
jgi:lipoprotein-releasing system permease protein